jgi:hypothetical protein
MKRVIEHNEVDRILSRGDEIVPSSGFAISVMDAVRREAAAPPPIPFPWKRALPGLVAAAFTLALVLVSAILAIAHLGAAPATTQFSISWPSLLMRTFQRSVGSVVNWTLFALLVTFVSVKLSMRLASGRA